MNMDDGHWDTMNDRDDDWIERDQYQRAVDRHRFAQAQEDRDTGAELEPLNFEASNDDDTDI
jgi:hypothetical protein